MDPNQISWLDKKTADQDLHISKVATVHIVLNRFNMLFTFITTHNLSLSLLAHFCRLLLTLQTV